ncbi:hypothetical protein OSB04_019142 [Centaurea solstitialis]|uniref:Integrase catalytic domain-containing protein n=1 Tax=Centaurea solstitialis TaxID=347529 RepID=A0AA38SPR5_9ASTR|nr:hypothetical protein OSB04_019142 [Centaurea solstitialis]
MPTSSTYETCNEFSSPNTSEHESLSNFEESPTQKKRHVSTWVVDSGCSRHMIGTLELLSSYIQQEGSFIAFGRNQKGKIKGYGMIVKGEVRMNQVSYVDGLKHNLISVSQLYDNGLDVMFKIKFCIMYKADTLIEVMRANRRGDLYLIFFETLKAKGRNILRKDHLRSACKMGKIRRSSYKTKFDPSYDNPLQMLHVDLCGPISMQSLGGKKYIMVLIDEFSRFTWVEFVRKKSQVPVGII